MREMIEEYILNYGTTFVIVQGGEQIGEAEGYKNSADKVVFFRPGVEVREGDWLVAKDSQAKLFVKEADPLRDEGQPIGVKIFYETRIDYERQESAARVIAMLDDIADAIWTLSDEKMPPEKKKLVRAAVTEIQDALKRMPGGAAGGLAAQIASRLAGGS